MKSYFLAPILSRGAAITALSAVLPFQRETWLLKDEAGDVMAYFSLVDPDRGRTYDIADGANAAESLDESRERALGRLDVVFAR